MKFTSTSLLGSYVDMWILYRNIHFYRIINRETVPKSRIENGTKSFGSKRKTRKSTPSKAFENYKYKSNLVRKTCRHVDLEQ